MDEGAIANLIVVGVAIAIAAFIPALAQWLPVPGVVLEIVLGAIVGPHILDFAHPDQILYFLHDFGLGVLFLMAGFELNPADLRGKPILNAAIGWVISLVIAVYASFVLVATGRAQAPYLTALALSTTSIGLLIPMLRDADLMRPPYGPLVLSAGALGEGAPLFILPIVLAHLSGAGPQALIMAAFAASAASAIILASYISRGSFATLVDRTMGTSGQLPMRLAICLLILLIVVAEKFKMDFVLGAFVAGAVVRAAIPEAEHKAMAARLDGIGSAFFVPLFFLTSGMQLDIAGLLEHPALWAMAGVYALLMLITRGAPALLLYGGELTLREALALAFHSGTQLSLVIAIAAIGVRRGQMPSDQAAALVSAAAFTALLYPALAAMLLRKPAS